ncbi:hypothetical protein HUN08_01860 [Gordonia sp. X0973]|uniref:hypothetical protein n=1 Tax=Gordonia sp. X0973 TaxID=2742602 RepID=UPI000F53FDEA|nr:hypothetical protein [Gordonia sp. X0973]QKT06075.1 hypothetical protein HUN08_01860 [Gordonia sp. X0973]
MAIKNPMTVDEIHALPQVVGIEEASRALGWSRLHGYRLNQAGEFPLPVHKVGNRFKIKKSDLLDYLGLSENPAPTPTQPASDIDPSKMYSIRGDKLLALLGGEVA